MAEILFKKLSYQVVGAAMEVHRLLGSGFLEAVYQTALAHEFKLLGIPFEQQKRLTVKYQDVIVGDYIAKLWSYVLATAPGRSVKTKKIREN